MALFDLFGLQLDVPADWEDHSVFRFVAPPKAELSQGVMSAGKTTQRRTNVVVSRHRVVPDTSEIDFLVAAHNAAAQQADSFKVLQAGSGALQGWPAAWEDTQQTFDGMTVPIFQRHIAVRLAPNAIGVVVLTGDRRELESVAASLGLAF